MNVTYPDLEVQLTGRDGNVFGVIGSVAKAIRRAHGALEAQAFTEAAFACGSYSEALSLCMETVVVS